MVSFGNWNAFGEEAPEARHSTIYKVNTLSLPAIKGKYDFIVCESGSKLRHVWPRILTLVSSCWRQVQRRSPQCHWRSNGLSISEPAPNLNRKNQPWWKARTPQHFQHWRIVM